MDELTLNILLVVIGLVVAILSTQVMYWTTMAGGDNQYGSPRGASSFALEAIALTSILLAWATAVFGHDVFTAQYTPNGSAIARTVFLAAGILALARTIFIHAKRPFWLHKVTMGLYAFTLGTIVLLLLFVLTPPFRPLFEL